MKEYEITKFDGLRTTLYPNGVVSVIEGVQSSYAKLDLLDSSVGPITKPLLPQKHRYRKQQATALKGQFNEYYSNGQTTAFSGVFGIPSNIAESDWPSTFANLSNEALDSLSSKVRGSLDLSISAFEWKQTALMIRSLSPGGIETKLRQLKLDLAKRWKARRKSLTEAEFRSLLTVPGDLWLQYQYGWRPLMLDIFGAALESQRHVVNTLEAFSASSMRPLSGSIPGDIGYGRKNSFSGWADVKGKMAVKYGMVLDSGILSGDRLQFFTSLNPTNIAWELIPYSFVVDWFVDISSFLRESETALINNVAFIRGYKTEIIAYDCRPTVRWGGEIVDGNRRSGELSSQLHYSYMNRTVQTSYPTPNLPRFKANLGSEQLLSAAALLAQFLPSPKAFNVPRNLRDNGRQRASAERPISLWVD